MTGEALRELEASRRNVDTHDLGAEFGEVNPTFGGPAAVVEHALSFDGTKLLQNVLFSAAVGP